ncbi:MAG: peptide chain release factor aRF-1, partial [Candidatus Thermoplasmatota archaeon]|nr:peptide chain release factor aRF-1 [Candidatus Thermoplasmatota archaeon]
INVYAYRCDSTFFLEPLEQFLVEREKYGLLIVDRKEATIGILSGKNIRMVDNMQSLVPSKHGMGGQSQRRFERIIEIAAHEWFVKVGQVASAVFLADPDIKGILVGGPGPTKDYFVKEVYLDYRIQQKIINQFDTGYTDEYGLRELVDKASAELTTLGLTKEKDIGQRFMREITKTDGGLSVYGENEIRHALDLNAVDTIMLSEALRLYRVKIGCSCGYFEEKTIKEEDLEKDLGNCPKCGGRMSILEKKDIIQDISELADKGGAKVELMSTETNEGETILKAFGGIAGILRYKIS